MITKSEEPTVVIFEWTVPAEYETALMAVFNPDYFTALGLELRQQQLGGGAGNASTFPYRYIESFMNYVFQPLYASATAPSDKIAKASRETREKSFSLETAVKSMPAPSIATSETVRPPSQHTLLDTVAEDISERHPYSIRPPSSSETEIYDSPQDTTTALPTTVLLRFEIAKVGPVLTQSEYDGKKRQETSEDRLEENAEGKTMQELMQEQEDDSLQYEYKQLLPKILSPEQFNVMQAWEKNEATSERVFYIRTKPASLPVKLNFELFPNLSSENQSGDSFW